VTSINEAAEPDGVREVGARASAPAAHIKKDEVDAAFRQGR